MHFHLHHPSITSQLVVANFQFVWLQQHFVFYDGSSVALLFIKKKYIYTGSTLVAWQSATAWNAFTHSAKLVLCSSIQRNRTMD